MAIRRRRAAGSMVGAAALTLLSVAVGRAALATPPLSPGPVDTPHVLGPLATTVNSYPFNSSPHAHAPLQLGAYGYTEEEFLISGRARIYHWPQPGTLISLGAGPYTTRVLVRRPVDPARFNGVVVVEPLNSSLMVDAPLMWNESHRHFMARGYVWVGVTIKPVAGRALQRFDAQRYAAISFANPLPESQRCVDPELGPSDTSQEVGHAFDIISQVGSWARSRWAQNPLAGHGNLRIYLTGYSQSGGYTLTYANAISPFSTRADGGRIFDGYLEAGNGPFNVVLNNCAAPSQRGTHA